MPARRPWALALAHLMIALCRAINIPARFVSTIDFGADPILGTTDFHACVEAYLGDRWYLFDLSGVAIPMGFVRLGTGRDAADTAFSTIFGGVVGSAPVMRIEAVPNAQGWWWCRSMFRTPFPPTARQCRIDSVSLADFESPYHRR